MHGFERDIYGDIYVYSIKEKNINVDTISFKDISRNLILDFLSWLENERKNSIQTRNQRLAAWKSFCKYLQFEDPQYFELCNNIRDIEPKRYTKNTLKYLSIEAIKILLEQPNMVVKREFRDLAILSLLYDSGARVQELIDLKVSNLTLDGNFKVIITGKGNKTRIVPINKEVAKILKQYIKNFELKSSDILFTNKYGNKITRQGIFYIIEKYITKAKKVKPDVYKNSSISPHSFRHSKAMHLLENGVNLIYIRDFLGHVSVKTTEVYAVANPEIRRKQIEAASKTVIKTGKYSEKDRNDLLKFLREEL